MPQTVQFIKAGCVVQNFLAFSFSSVTNKQWKQTVEHQQERGFVSLHALI